MKRASRHHSPYTSGLARAYTPGMIVFGPVPSRRLGRSLGVNHLPTKVCSYACVYCQVGRTLKMHIQRQAFLPPEEVAEAVRKRVEQLRRQGESPDFITFVPDGEPTLDQNLGRMLDLMRPLGIPLAVITNASLLWQEEVQEDLLKADFVSLKVDAVSEALWRRINRPHGSLRLSRILQALLAFRKRFPGTLVTETMLVNVDYGDEFAHIAAFLKDLRPHRAYLAVPTRPPAEPWVEPPAPEVLHRAYRIFAEALGEEHVEYLVGYEGDAFSSTGDAETDLLSITAVHPMREDAVQALLQRSGASWEVVERLIREGKLLRVEYQGHRYYLRALPSRRR